MHCLTCTIFLRDQKTAKRLCLTWRLILNYFFVLAQSLSCGVRLLNSFLLVITFRWSYCSKIFCFEYFAMDWFDCASNGLPSPKLKRDSKGGKIHLLKNSRTSSSPLLALYCSLMNFRPFTGSHSRYFFSLFYLQVKFQSFCMQIYFIKITHPSSLHHQNHEDFCLNLF